MQISPATGPVPYRSLYQKVLSAPAASVICFLAGVLAKAGLIRIFLDSGPDKFGQAVIAKNFLRGNGLSLATTTLGDISQKVYSPAVGWPKLYSILLAPLLSVFDGNFMLADFILTCLTTLFFFWYLRKILLLVLPVWSANLFLVFQGCFFTSYITDSTPTDFMGLAFMLAGVYYLMTITRGTSFSYLPTVLSVIFLTAASLTRYQYFPVALFVLLVLGIAGTSQKQKLWIRSAAISIIVTGLINTAIFLFQKLTAGSAWYLVPVQKGFYPSNLQYIHPFVLESFINLHFYAVQLSDLFRTGYQTWISIGKWVSIFLLAVLTGAYFNYLKKSRWRINTNTDSFMIIGGATTLATVGLLFCLSLVLDKNIGPPMHIWTYVMDGRYYAFPVLFIQISMWMYVSQSAGTTSLNKLLRSLFILVFVFETLHGLYFISKKISRPLTSYDRIIHADARWETIIRFTIEESLVDPNRKIVITGFSKLPGFLADWYGHTALYSPLTLNTTMPRSSKPAVLLIALPENDVVLMNDFLKQPGVQLYREAEEYRFYTYYIEPVPGNK